MDEKLRFVIELQNKASAELQKFGKDLQGVQPTAGMKHTANWFQTLETASTSANKALRPLIGGLSTIGTGGLAAGLSIAGLIAQFRDLAKAMPALQELSRQTGISKTELERLKATAANLNIDPSKMTAAMSYFSREMVYFSKGAGELYGEMQNKAGGLARKIAQDWKDHPEQALKEYLGWLAEIPAVNKAAGKSMQEGVQIQRYWAGKGFGDEDMAQIVGKGMGGFQEAYSQAARDVHEITDETVAAAEKFDRSIASFERTWKDFETTVGPTVFDGLRHATDDFRAVFDELKGAMAWFDKVKDHPVQAAAEAATSAIDAQAAANSSTEDRATRAGGPQEKILFDAPGAVSKVIHFFTDPAPKRPTDSRPITLRAPAPVPATLRPPTASAFHPDDDRLSRARASDAPDRSLDGFVMGALDMPVTHLVGTLKTAAAALDGNLRPAAFHPASGTGLTAALDPEATIAAGTRRGFVEAFREIQGLSDVDGKGSGGGFMPTSFGGGGMGGGYSPAAAGRAPNLRYGRQHDGEPYSPADGGAVPTGAHTPLKDLIAQHETGGTGAAGYDTVYGHAEQPGSKMHALAPPKPITQMTIGEVLAYQRQMKPRAGSAAFPVGRAQWVEHTLRGLTRGMDPNTIFSPEVQEKLFDRSIAGRMGQGPGGFRSEWDSLRAVPDGEIERAMTGHREALQKAAASTPSVSTGPRGAYPDWMDNKSRREMAGINAPLARDLIAASAETGAHFRILQGLRTEAEAAANARRGVGVRNSQHRWGAAADLKLTDGAGHDLDRNDPAYERFATAFEKISHAHGGSGRWLGHVPGWAWDRAHFDQGIGYGQTHKRDPYGSGGPTAGDIAASNKEIFSGPDNPFLRAAKPLDAAADKLKAVVAPMPAVKPEPSRIDATAGQRAALDPIELNIRHHRDGRTSIAAKHGEGVKVSLRTAPTMVQTG